MPNQDLSEARLKAFEAMLGAVQREYADILSKMDKMNGLLQKGSDGEMA